MRARRLMLTAASMFTALLTVGALGMAPAAAIAKGALAADGQFPFATKLVLSGIPTSDSGTRDSACSAALISPTWLITAGHCFHDGTGKRVSGVPRYTATARLGTASTTDPTTGVTATVTWVEQSSKNDIALARLDTTVTGITPLALNTAKPVRGQVLAFAGWGATSSAGAPSDQLWWGKVKVSTVRTYTVQVVGHWPYPDTSACPYDSGAPYFTETSPPQLVSVENNGPSCPHNQQETTARVDPIISWVKGIVTDLP